MPDTSPPNPATSVWETANRRNQVVAQLASGSLPAAATEGRVFAVTDRDRLEIDTGSALIPGPAWGTAGRVGVNLSRVANQSIATGTGTFTAISWDTETTDTDGFIAVTSGSITVPTNLGGIYSISAKVTWASSPGANSTIEVLVGATAWNRTVITAATQMTDCGVSAVLALPAASVVQIRVSQGSGGAINVTGQMQMWRLGA